MKKVAMIGVGKLGQDCAEVMAEHYDVVGYDVEPRTPLFPMRDTIQEAVSDRDIIFIAAPTPHDPMYGGETPTSYLRPKDFDYTIVTEILEEVNKYVNQNQLVVLISTVLPGTVREQLRPKITNARFIYNPYLIAMGTVKFDMVNPEMIIIGTEDGSTTGDAKELIDFYQPLMQNDPRVEVGTWDEAEAIKIFYNTFISTKVALVNMIQDVAQRSGNINVDIVTNALAKSTYRITGPAYMTAGMGDGGACHPRDNIALRYMAEKLNLGYDLFDSIMTAREKQAYNMALECRKYGGHITIIGKAYKPGVPYTNGSSSILTGHYMKMLGMTVNYYDIHTGDDHIPINQTNPLFLIGYWEDWVKEYPFPRGSIVIDPWRKIEPDCNISKIVHYGNTRQDSPSNDPVNYNSKPSEMHKRFWNEIAKHEDDVAILNVRRGDDDLFKMAEDTIVDIIHDQISKGKKYFIFDNQCETFTEREVNCVYSIVEKAKIDPSMVYYSTCSLDADELHKVVCEKHQIEKPINVVIISNFEMVSSGGFNKAIHNVPYVIGKRDKKFLCMNRVPHQHRMCLLGLMNKKNLIDDGYYSYYDDSHTFFDGTLEFAVCQTPDIKYDIIEGLLDVKERLPLRLTLDEQANNPSSLEERDADMFRNSYFSIISETYFFSHDRNNDLNSRFLTEKTFNAIVMKHPFVLLNKPYSLQLLNDYGYKTFHPYIDETYDTIEDDQDRLIAIVDEIERLVNMSDEQYIEWQNNIAEIVEHNYNVLMSHNKPESVNNIKLG